MAVSTTAGGVGGSAIYETKRAVDEYLLFHFDDASALPYSFGPKEALQFPARLARICEKFTTPETRKLVLDLGCAVGGASFELSKSFDKVIGIDFSKAFVDAAEEMKAQQKKEYSRLVEGSIYEDCLAQLPEGVFPERTQFLEGDACNLDPKLGPFDCLLAANLLCRLPDPFKFLNDLPKLFKTGGILVLVSPYSWLPGYTNPENWVGGFTKEGEKVFTSDVVTTTLKGLNFELLEDSDIPFLIREHRRKFQWGCSHLTVWRFFGEK